MTDQADPSTPNLLDVELLLKQARGYLAFGEQMAQFAGPFSSDDQSGTDWGTVLRQHFDQFKTVFTQPAGDTLTGSELARLSTLTLDIWWQTAAKLGVAGPEGRDAGAWRDYQQVLGEYLALLRQAASEALDLMEHQLSERASAGKSIDSLRELYNLWVDCNEKTYGQLLRGEPYAELNGRLFNTLLRCYARGETAA